MAVQGEEGEDLVAVSVDVSRDLHRRFKALCAIKGKTMSEMVTCFLEEEVDKARKHADAGTS